MRIAHISLLLSLAPALAHAGAAEDFFDYTGGVRLAFEAEALPKGHWFDELRPLDAEAREKAARIALTEARKYPPGYLRGVGLEVVGLFAACVSKSTDGFRPYEEALGGYRYFGMWNGRDAVVAAHYSDGQLPLTFHHEVFHHVDATRDGVTSRSTMDADDHRFAAALDGTRRYAAPKLPKTRLKAAAEGYVLETSVGAYSAKSPGEDQAETARYLMTTLPDALLQVSTRPELAGSQRMLHVLRA